MEENLENLPAIKSKLNSAVEKFSQIDRSISNSLKKSDDLVKKAKIKHSAGWSIGGKDKRLAIEALQDVTADMAENQQEIIETQKSLFDGQKALNQNMQTLFAIGAMSITANRLVHRELKMKLENASQEELSELAKEELKNTIQQIEQMHDTLQVQERLKVKIKEQESTISQLRNSHNNFRNELNNHNNNFSDYKNKLSSLSIKVDRLDYNLTYSIENLKNELRNLEVDLSLTFEKRILNLFDGYVDESKKKFYDLNQNLKGLQNKIENLKKQVVFLNNVFCILLNNISVSHKTPESNLLNQDIQTCNNEILEEFNEDLKHYLTSNPFKYLNKKKKIVIGFLFIFFIIFISFFVSWLAIIIL